MTNPLFLEAIRAARAAPGYVRECVDCRHWQAGTVVYRGNTQGICLTWQRATGADCTCDRHNPKPSPTVCPEGS